MFFSLKSTIGVDYFLSMCVCTLLMHMFFFIGVTFLIIIDSGQWLYLVVIFIKVNAITVVSSLRAKIGINTIFSLSKKFKSIIFNFL
jgi:hypothetical protein